MNRSERLRRPAEDDPFADSFASFDDEPQHDAAEAQDETPPAADDADVRAAVDAEAQADAEFDAAEAAPQDVDAPEMAEEAATEPAVAASSPSADAPFDWFANFPKVEAETAAAETAPEADTELADRSWLSSLGRLREAVTSAEAQPAETLEAPAPITVDETPLDTLPAEPEPEAFADAPSVPAAYDDALTEPAPFEPIAGPADAWEDPVFAPAEPEAPAPSPVAEMIASADAALGEAMVPRIAIHVFAQRAGTAAVAQTAAADRRLQRASTAVRPGGLPEALALYASSPTPALVIVENTAPAAELLADLDRLAEVCDPGTKVVVIGEANDISLYRELMRRGVSEYLVPPLSPLLLIRTIGNLYADPETAFVGRTIAFVGAKGGVGSSTIAHNFAWCLSERADAQACVVDYDLAFGTAGLDFNQDPVQGLHDALEKPDRLDATLIDRMLARCTERLSLFAAPATLDDDYDIPAEVYEEVAAKIRSTAPFMVLDLPHVWSGWMRKTLLGADEVVLVAQPDLASLRNAKNLVELIAKARPNDAPPRLVLNQVGLPGRPEIPLKEFSKALGLEPSMILPFDAKLFGHASNNGQMIAEVNPKAKASEALMQFVQAVTRREPVAPKPKSLVERLLKGG